MMKRLQRAFVALLMMMSGALLPVSSVFADSTLCSGSFADCGSAQYSTHGYENHFNTSYWRAFSGHNCTNYVGYMLSLNGDPGHGALMGNANQWDNTIGLHDGGPGEDNWGYTINATPAVGSIALWENKNGGTGHVAYVEEVTNASTIKISEDNYPIGPFSWRSINTSGDWPDKFLHIKDLPTSAPNSFRPAVIQRPSGETDVAVVGPGNSLAFYYTVGNNWGGGVIPGSQAYSTPAIVQRPSGETIIVVQGPNNSLLFYFNTQGTNDWDKLVVPGAVAYSAPAIVQRPSGEIDIAVQGANNTLAFYYTIAGAPHFAGGPIPGTQAYGEPAMIQRSSGETDIAVQGAGNSMNMYFNAPGFNNWGTSAVAAPGWALSAPSIVQRPTGETDIAVQGPNNSLDLYINAQGTNAWGRIPAGGAGTTFNAPNPPAMVQRSNGETNIVVKGPGDRADFYFNAPNSPNWGSIPAAVSGYAFRAPAMVQRPTTGETDLVIIGPNNRLDFYFNTLGSPYWSNIPIAGSNSAS